MKNKKPNKVRYCLTLDPAVVEKFDLQAAAENRNRSNLLETMMRDYLVSKGIAV